jgi:hypothetical protein
MFVYFSKRYTVNLGHMLSRRILRIVQGVKSTTCGINAYKVISYGIITDFYDEIIVMSVFSFFVKWAHNNSAVQTISEDLLLGKRCRFSKGGCYHSCQSALKSIHLTASNNIQ